VIRARRAALALEYLPPRPRALAKHLRVAPEIAVLAVVDDALRAALVALLAEHPTLAELGSPRDPTTLREARGVIRCALALRDALERYRAALAPVFDGPTMPDDDIPF
jgi:hypothetical protein